MILEDNEGKLLGASIAADGQWRFPYREGVPEKFEKALLEFEDRRFHSHIGFDIIGIGRAIQQNIKSKKVVSGGSTLTMQLMRMSRRDKPRSVFQKFIELILATRAELSYSKSELLSLYASNAPFGGNVVGLDAASWRYYQKQPELLSWAEAATLAVLPNSPALIHPGRNRNALKAKRNRLLKRLMENGDMDALTYDLSLSEPLPDKPHPLPQHAPHLLERIANEKFNNNNNDITRMRTTIDRDLQIRSNQILNRHHEILKGNGVHNAAAIIIEVETGNILAYVGNIKNAGEEHSSFVDVANAPRSSGSTLKPILYAMMMNEGQLLPNTLVPDIPTNLGSYKPENYNATFDGMVSAKRAIVRSLNIPLIRMLQWYGLEKFHAGLKQLNFESINQSPTHYGLPLILGGAEVTLCNLTNTYAGMARTLNGFYDHSGKYRPDNFRPINYEYGVSIPPIEDYQLADEAPMLSASSIYYAFEAMKQVERPNELGDWQRFPSNKQIAWKTGTSFGFKDAWAIGVTPRYAVGVWTGNADGEGRPGLVGVKAAAPVLFDLFNLLPASDWFTPPHDELIETTVCKQSGYKATSLCDAENKVIPAIGARSKTCPFHKKIMLDKNLKYQVNGDCEMAIDIQPKPWFILPPVEAHYYKFKSPDYIPPPPFRTDCIATSTNQLNPMQLIYPRQSTKVYLPKDLDGTLSPVIFKAAHLQEDATIHWHLNNTYIGATENFHHLELKPESGKHTLTLVDQDGNKVREVVEIFQKERM